MAAKKPQPETVTVVMKRSLRFLAPPPPLHIDEWAERHRILSRKDSARPGRWRTEPQQRDVLRAFTDPRVRKVVVMAASQDFGKSQVMNNVIAYYACHDPSNILVQLPTIDLAIKWSKGRLDPMIESSPALLEAMGRRKSRNSDNTLYHRQFDGGQMFIVGANSPSGLASQSVRVVMSDEVDRYDSSAGEEGDPLTLAQQRTVDYGEFAVLGEFSTPLMRGYSRIEASYEQSDKRIRRVKCPECGTLQTPTIRDVQWDKAPGIAGAKHTHLPETAGIVCQECGVKWTETQRQKAIVTGCYEAQAPFTGIAGFHCNSYCCPRASLPRIVRRYLEAKGNPEQEKTFVNLFEARTWAKRGETANWETLWSRREPWHLGNVPARGLFLTAGVDVQDDRLEVGVYAWARQRESWLVDYRVLRGDTSQPSVWAELDALLENEWPHESGMRLPIRVMAVDSGGHRTRNVYAFAQRRAQPSWAKQSGVAAPRMRTVAAVKGADRWDGIVVQAGAPDGAKRRSSWVFTLGVSHIKDELVSALQSDWPTREELTAGTSYPAGAHHIPEDIGEEYCKQLCSETLETERARGRTVRVWRAKPGARNEALDILVYARAAAHMFGIDRFGEHRWRDLEAALVVEARPEVEAPPMTVKRRAPRQVARSRYMDG